MRKSGIKAVSVENCGRIMSGSGSFERKKQSD